MDATQAIDIAREALVTVLVLATPILLSGLITALLVGLIQAATQVQDQTLSLVPKMLAMGVAALLAGPWILARLVQMGQEMFSRLP